MQTNEFINNITTHRLQFLGQVNPPDSPETESPLQGSLHSEGSSGSSAGNTHDDFVMIDFVSALIGILTYHLHLGWALGTGTVANDIKVVFTGGKRPMIQTSSNPQTTETLISAATN